MELLVTCGSPNQQLLTLKEVLWNHDLRQTNDLISSSISNSSFSLYFILLFFMEKFKKSTYRARRTLISKVGIYGKVDHNTFSKSSKRRKSKLYATNNRIESVLNVGSHKQQYLALKVALTHPKLIDQAADCG